MDEGQPSGDAGPGEGAARARAVAAFGLAVLLYAGLAWGIGQLVPTPEPERTLFLPRWSLSVRPEPAERLQFLAGLACALVLPTALDRLLRRVPWSDRAVRGVGVASAVLGTGWLLAVAAWSEVPGAPRWLAGTVVLTAAAMAAPPAPRSWLAPAVSVLLIGLGWRAQLANDRWFFLEFNVWHHLDVLLGAVNGVAHGRTVLVDLSSQYGVLWPYVAALATRPFGLSVASLSGFFATLGALQVVAAWFAVARVAGSRSWWTAAAVAATLGSAHGLVAWMPFNLGGALFDAPDHVYACVPFYFQWFPLRTVWAAVFVAFVPLVFTRRWLVPVGYALAGVAVLWNLDQGVVVLGAWAAQLLYRDLAARRGFLGRVLLHGAAAALAVGLAVGLYALVAHSRAGAWPDLAGALRFQRIFYGAGFYMLPMRIGELWQPVVALQVVTLAWCLRQALAGAVTEAAAWRFFLAILGLGTLSYYQGRSMPTFLPTAFFPAAMLAFSWAHQGFARLRRAGHRPRPGAAFATLALSLWFFAPIVTFVRALPETFAFVRDPGPSVSPVATPEALAALRADIGGRAAVILAEPSTWLHLQTGSWSALPVASPTEVLLRSQLAEVQAVIDRPETTVVLHPALAPELVDQLDLSALIASARPGGFVLLRHGTTPGPSPATVPDR